MEQFQAQEEGHLGREQLASVGGSSHQNGVARVGVRCLSLFGLFGLAFLKFGLEVG